MDDKLGQWLTGTKVADADGIPITVHHGGASPRAFRPFTHFGSHAAARDRLGHLGFNGNVVEAHLSILNPVAFRDKGFQHTPFMFLNDLSGCYGFYEQAYALSGLEEYELDTEITRLNRTARSFAPIVRYLESIGFDGLKYENLVEDRGSTSWAIFRPGQVWRVGADKPDPGGRMTMSAAAAAEEVPGPRMR